MKRPKLRKASKRLTCSKKYRIQKNVAAHNKKVRRMGKGSGGKKSSRKDPGVPASAPFKEQVLFEAEQQKQMAADEKKRRKEMRRAEVNNNTGSLESLQQDALDRQKKFEQTSAKEATESSILENKETSKKAFHKEFLKVVESADVIIEVLDARDPLGCRSSEMEKAILRYGDKKIVLLLNKIDLVPKENVEEWLKYLRNEFPTVAFKSSTQSQSAIGQYKTPIKVVMQDILTNKRQCIGADSLMKLLSNYCRNLNLQTTITVGVVGFPNVGKSSVINSLKRSRACNVGALPGVTKSMQEVSLNKHINILDCPGIVMAASSSPTAIVLRNCASISKLEDPLTPVETILGRCRKDQIMLHYRVGDYTDTVDFLKKLSLRRGRVGKKGAPNVQAAARMVLQDWNTGKISYYTRPPETKQSVHIESRVVEKMAKEFDWECLEEDNMKALRDVCGPTLSKSLLYEPPMMEEDGGEGTFLMGDDEPNEEAVEEMEEDVEAKSTKELGNYTIEIKTRKRSAKPEDIKAKKPKESAKGLDNILTEGSNIQANHSIKQLMKLNKKKSKRADRLSDKLGDSLLSAMDLSSKPESNQDYDFNVDYNL